MSEPDEKYLCRTCIHAGEGGVIPAMGLCLHRQMWEHNTPSNGAGPSRVFARLICGGHFWEGADGSKKPHWTESCSQTEAKP